MARLAAWVHVTNPETNQIVAFGPDTEPEPWAVELITNPKAWAPDEEPTPEGDDDDPTGSDDGQDTDDDADDADDEADGQDGDDDADDEADGQDGDRPEAPRKNASRDEWAAYAKALGFDVPEEASRSDIIAAVEADAPSTDA